MEAIRDACRAPAGSRALWWGRRGGGKQRADVPGRTGAGGGWSCSSRLGVLLMVEEMEEWEMEEAGWQ